jgi:acetyl esterase/lipase
MRHLVALPLFFALSCCPMAVAQDGNKEAKPRDGAKASFSIVETIHDYKVVDGKPLKAYVYRQPGHAVGPALITLHPGALMMGSAQGKLAESGKPVQGKAKFIERGFTIVSLEYRLAPQAKLPQIVEDLQDGYKWVHEKGPELLKIDPKKIGVMGTSAGGYLALLSGYCVSPRPRFIIAVSGYGDIIGDWYTKPDAFYRQKPLVTEKQAFRPNAGMDLYLYCRQNGLWPKVVTGHDPATEPEEFKPYCPVQNVTREYPPTLLLHGDKDTDVPYQQSELMQKELKAKGVEHVFILNPGAGHGIMAFNPNDNLAFNKLYEQLIDFAIKHTR